MAATITDKVLLLPYISWILSRTLLSIPGSALRGDGDAKTALEHITNTATRTLMMTLTPGQLQLVLPAFVSNYKSWCKSQKHPVDIVDIPNTNIQGFWIGSKDAKYVMLYCHGGGFVMPGLAPHIEMLFRYVKWSNNNIGVFCPAYTLAPSEVFPTQLGQCVEALRYVLSLPGREPKTTLLGGDSAGGNLVLGILSHISGHKHPQPNIVRPLEMSQKLFGAIAIAPWVSSDVSKFDSMTKYDGRDIIHSTVGHSWMEVYKGAGKNVPFDEFITAELASPEWWSSVQVESLLAVAGEHEILRDAIVSWADKFREGARDTDFKFVIGKGEIHDAPLNAKAESELDGKDEECQEAAIRAWIKSRLV